MNTSILQKCLDELQKENPKLDYIRGMIETIIEMSTPYPIKITPPIMDIDIPPYQDKSKLSLMQLDHIEQLIKECGMSLNGESISDAIKRITDLDAIPDNFQSIKNFFAQIKGGVKMVDSSTSQGEIIKSQ